MNNSPDATHNLDNTYQPGPPHRNAIESQGDKPPAPDAPPNVIKDETEQNAVKDPPDQQRSTPYDAILERIATSNRLMILFTGIIAVNGVIGGIIIFWQLRVMQGQLAEMRSSSADTRLLAASAKKQADNTERLANAAIDQVRQLEISVKQTQVLADATQRTANETSKLVSLSQEPTIYVDLPDNSPFLRQDSRGKYPVLLINSSHTGVKDVRFHYSQMALQERSDSDNLLLKKGPSMTEGNHIEKIDAGETVPFKFDLNNPHLNKLKFEFDSGIIHIEFYYVRITYRRELDNKFFSLEKAYMIPHNSDNKVLLESELGDFFTPSEGIIRGVQNVILSLRGLHRSRIQLEKVSPGK